MTIDAHEVFSRIWVGSIPVRGTAICNAGFHVLVLCVTDFDCTGFVATCSRCACVVLLEEEPDEEDDVFCDACEHEIDLAYEREQRDIAKEEIARLRRDLCAAHASISIRPRATPA